MASPALTHRPTSYGRPARRCHFGERPIAGSRSGRVGLPLVAVRVALDYCERQGDLVAAEAAKERRRTEPFLPTHDLDGVDGVGLLLQEQLR